jgi:aminoglycoside phosphotransferase (APT) family kinase protein
MTISARINQVIVEQLVQELGLDGAYSLAGISEITGGWESRIFSGDLLGVGAQEKIRLPLILRYYETGVVDDKAHRDYALMDQLRGLNTQVPEVYTVLESEQTEGPAILLMQRIAGQLARDIAGNAILEQQAEVHAAIHGLRRAQFSENLRESFDLEASSFGMDAEMLQLKERVATSELSDFKGLLEWLDAKRKQVKDADLVFLHNDFHPENVIVDDANGELFIMDWGFAGIGDRRSDLAWTLHQLLFMLGAEARSAYLGFYEKAFGETIENLEFFEVLKLSQRLSTIGLWLNPDYAHPIMKIDAEAIRTSYRIHVVRVYQRVREMTGVEMRLFEKL